MVYVMQPLLPLVSPELGVDATRASLLVSASTLGIAIFVIPLARLSERVGRARIIVLGLAGAVVTGGLTVIAPGFGLLLAARGLQGVALAAIPAAALAWVAENIEPSSVTRVAGLYIAGTTVGGMGGRVLAGVVADLADWRTAMLVVTLLAAALTVAAFLLLPRGRPVAPRAEAPAASTEPADWRRDRATRVRIYLMGGLGMAMFVGVYNVIGYRTQAPPFLLGTGLGSMFYLTYLAGTATSSLAGRLEGHVGLRTAQVTGVAGCLLGALLTLPDSLVLVWVGLAVLAASFFLIHATSSAAAARLSPRPSASSARYTLAYYGGSSVGGVLLGHAWELGGWSGTVLAACAILTLAAVVAAGLPARLTRTTT